MSKSKIRAFKLKFWFRFFAVIDVLFAHKFDLKTYRKDGSLSAKTMFDKSEIDNCKF